MAAAEPLSPELVLVSPELRERALATLPAIDAEALFAAAARPAPTPHRKPETELATSPSFALALLSYVGEAVVLGALRGAALVGAIAAVAFLLAR